MVVELDISPETQTLMFFAGCSLALALILSITDDGSGDGLETVPVQYMVSRPSQSKTSRATTQKPSSKKLIRAPGGRMLPVELTDYIIDLLHSDKRSLKACSLTSRVFLPRARYHLFRTFSVKRNGKDPYMLRSYPNVARSIRRVVIHGNLCFEIANSVLVELGMVESLHLIGSDAEWKDVQWTLCRSQLPRFPRLKELTLSRVYFRSLGEMVSTLRTLPDLSKLSVDFEDIRYTTVPSHTDVGAFAAIRLPFRSLHMRLNFANAAPGKVPQILLTSGGPSLRHLSLDILSSVQRPALSIIEHIDLSRNTSLESLTICLPWYISRNPWLKMVSQDECELLMQTLLSQIHSSYFRKIKLRVTFPVTGHYNNIARWHTRVDFKFLDALMSPGKAWCKTLSREALERAESVSNQLADVTLELVLPCSSSPSLDHGVFEDTKRLLRGQLPMLTSRGILHILKA